MSRLWFEKDALAGCIGRLDMLDKTELELLKRLIGVLERVATALENRSGN